MADAKFEKLDTSEKRKEDDSTIIDTDKKSSPDKPESKTK
jgi:hypothetical protein